MPTPFEQFKSTLGINRPSLKGVGYNYSPTILQQGNDPGQAFLDKLSGRKTAGQNIYSTNKQENTNRLANDLVQKSAGLKVDEFSRPQLNLADFGQMGQSLNKSITEHGNLATQTAEAKNAYQTALTNQNLGNYGFSGGASVSGSDIPGATSNNVGARAAALAQKVMKGHTPYVYGGNSLVNGVDCSGLVQQVYRQLGIKLPRTTYEQAKAGKVVSVNDIRPGDLVFYGGDYHHVGIYVGNGGVVHAANSRMGVITSNLWNSNGKPTLVLRPY
jgi:cell wall-associated NlpC family hydrolase